MCKEFYFRVLGIDDSRVRNYCSKTDKGDGKQYRDVRGRSTKQLTPKHDIKFVLNHISSFKRVPSHYCRSQSYKEYLESGLLISKMYDMTVKNKQFVPIYRKHYITRIKTVLIATIFVAQQNSIQYRANCVEVIVN